METFYGQGPHHELYTAFAGLYFCWLVLRGVHVFSNLVPAGWTNVFNRVKSYTILVRLSFSFFFTLKFAHLLTYFQYLGVEVHGGFHPLAGGHPASFWSFARPRRCCPFTCFCQSVAHLLPLAGIRVYKYFFYIHSFQSSKCHQDWSLGVLYTKIVCGLTMMSPDWWLKHSLERVMHIYNINNACYLTC